MSSIAVDRPPPQFNGNGEERGVEDSQASANAKCSEQTSGDSPNVVEPTPNVYAAESDEPTYSPAQFSGPIFGTSAVAHKNNEDQTEPVSDLGGSWKPLAQNKDAPEAAPEMEEGMEEDRSGASEADEGDAPIDDQQDDQDDQDEIVPETQEPPEQEIVPETQEQQDIVPETQHEDEEAESPEEEPNRAASEGKDKAENSEMVIAKIEEVGTCSPGHPGEVEETPDDEEESAGEEKDDEGENVVIQEEIVTTASHDEMPVLEPVLGELGGQMEVGASRPRGPSTEPLEKYGVDEQGGPMKKPRKTTEALPIGGGGRRSLRSANQTPVQHKTPKIVTPVVKRRRVQEKEEEEEVEEMEQEGEEEEKEESGKEEEVHEEQTEESPKRRKTPARRAAKVQPQPTPKDKEEPASDSTPSSRRSLRHSPRVQPEPPKSTPKAAPTPKSKAPPKLTPKPVADKQTPAKAKATPSRAKGKKQDPKGTPSNDPYDLDNLDSVPAEIEVERDMFGSVRFTKPVSAGGSRFKHTSKVAQRKSGGMDDSSQSSGTPRSVGRKSTLSTPKGSANRSGSLQLFSDIDDVNSADDFDEPEEEEHETPAPKKSHKRNSEATSARKSRQSSQYSDSLPRPPKHVVSIPELSADDQLSADFNPNAFSYVAGSRVLAKWIDKTFYPGQVVSRDGLGRYKVHFLEDAVDRDMPPPDVVGLTALTVGKVLMVATGDELQPVEIKDTPSLQDSQEWYDCNFVVYNIVTEKEEKVHWREFLIAPEQAASFVSTQINEAAQSISMANVGEQRTRVRRSIAVESQSDSHSTPEPASRTPKRKVESEGKKVSHKKKPKPVVEQEPRDEDVDSKEEVKQLFVGYKFVLTSANRKQKAEEDSCDEDRPIVQFNKRNVRSMIEERGGTVLDDFNSCESIANLYLVADTHYRTHKYLSALARAIPCVSHLWIHNSAQANELKDHQSFMLPSGQTLETHELIEWHDRCPSLLSGKTVLVHTENRPANQAAMDFVQIWKPLVVCMGANAVETLPEDGHVDILLTDASCPPSLKEQCEEGGAFSVSSEWLIQAIITGLTPHHKAHPKYSSTYVEPQ